MSTVMEAYLTNAGMAVLNKVLASQGPLNFVRADVGDGKCTEEAACRARTSLVSKTGEATFVRAALKGGQATISIIYQNEGLETGFFVNEIGLYVEDPTTNSPVLYCYVTFGDYPDWIAPESSAVYTRTYDIITIVSNVSTVNVTTSPSTVVSMEDFNNVIAPEWMQSSKYHRGDFVLKSGVLYRCNTDISTPEAWNADHWDKHNVGYYLSRADEINSKPRFGVQGVGLSGAALTRLWDAVGMTATPSTDTVAGSSDFDDYAPFNRRKCVGTWSAGDGKAVFTVKAYEGDADYAEDGSMGDYVAVDVTPFYYIEDGDIIGVSEQQFPGWKIHPVCVDLDGNIRAHTYLPVYALSKKDGKAVSLPGFQNQNGAYATLWTAAKTYNDSDAAAYAILEPSAVDHYEWLLMTIEFATQNMQSVITSASSLRLSEDDKITAKPAANKIVIEDKGGTFIPGQMINIGSTVWGCEDITLQNNVVSSEKCDANGTPDSNGEYTLIVYGGTDRSDSITVGTSVVASRPWITGATDGYVDGIDAVLGHTGSPISNSSGKYPMRYRWRENVYGNQFMTAHDLADVRVSEGDEQYHLDWYYQSDPRKVTTPANFDLTTLQDPTKGWVKLSPVTPASSYVNGYVKTLEFDDQYPHVKVPTLTIGASSTTYYCDYAYLVYTPEVRAVRRRGYVYDGSRVGPRFFHAYHAPSAASWYYGGELFFIQ